MSFIHNREKLFKSKSSNYLGKKVTTGRMKTASSFTDPRAWSMDPRERSSFVMDAMAEMASSSGGEDNGPEIRAIEEQKLPEINWRRLKMSPVDRMVDDTDHELIKLNNKLFAAKDKIEELQNVNSNLLSDKTNTTAEVDNLRVLVTNMREQMNYLEGLRRSNEVLRNEDELKTSRELEDAKMEIEHLTKEIQIYSGMVQWHSNLREVQEKLSEEKKELVKTVSGLYAEKKKLSEDLKKREDDIAALEVQLQASAQGTLEKSVLRDRVAAKDEKILELNSMINRQTLTVEELQRAISMMTERLQNKEDLLNQERESLKATLDEKDAKISQLETKLHQTELLVAELESLRDQFRTTNIALRESVAAYKKDIEAALVVSDRLSDTVQILRSENTAKDREIEKLTLFPQNPDTMLYFSQLNRLVTSGDNFHQLEPDDQAELVESIKKVIIKLKTEMWGSNVTPAELQIEDFGVQAEPERSDNQIQCYPIVRSIQLQTCLPDEYLVMINNREEEMSKLHVTLSNCEQRLTEQAAEFDSLENSLFDAIEENYSKDLLIENADRNRQLLEETMEVLHKELNDKDALLANSLAEIHKQTEHCQSLKEALETTLQTTAAEYSEYVKGLETFIKFKEAQILSMTESAKEHETISQAMIEQMTSENEELTSRLEKETEANVELNNQVVCLMKSLKEKIARTKDIEEKLEKAELTIRRIIDHEGAFNKGDSGSTGDYTHAHSLCAQIRAYKSELADQLKKSYALEGEINRLRTSKRLMKKLLIKNGAAKKASDMKILRMAVHLRKIAQRGVNLKGKLSKKEVENGEMSASLRELAVENDMLKNERSVLLQELYATKKMMREIETSLEKSKEKEILHEELKMKMERMVLKLMKKVTKYKTEVKDRRELEAKFKNHQTMNEQLYHEIDLLKNENLSLSTTICGFERKLSTLMELPEKESSSVELQVSFEESSMDDTCGLVGTKAHYENVILTMKKDHNEASEQAQRQYMNTLKMLKDTYERDISHLKTTHSENLLKMQMMHAEELHHQSRKVDWEIEKSLLVRAHADELSELTKRHESTLRARQAEFEGEKHSLAEDLAEMKSEFMEIHKATTLEMETMKTKFKEQITKLEELQRVERVLLRKKFDQQIEVEVEKRMAELKPSTEDKKIQSLSVECSECGTDPDSYVNTKESSTNTAFADGSIVISCGVKEERIRSFQLLQQGSSSIQEFPAFPDRLFLLTRIGELEKALQMQQMESARKNKHYEKRLKHENMKAKEIAHILDEELRYSTDVHCKLGRQYNRAERLAMEKETLAARLLLAEQQLALIKKEASISNHPAITNDEGLADAERELEISLTRLKEKIDMAVEQEKRLSSAGVVDFITAGLPETDRIPQKELTKNSETGSGDMKVIVIQQHKVTHAWSSQIDNVYS